MAKRESVTVKEGRVTRVLKSPVVLSEETMPQPVPGKTLSPDWAHVVSQRSNQGLSSLLGLQLTNSSDIPETFIDKPTVDFLTASSYTGQWTAINLAGFGTYRLPHGVEYEGEIADGMLHGEGTLIYPNGSKMFGEWVEGRMTKRRYQFSDGLQFTEPDWKYCQMPDRRFQIEHTDGLRPAGRSHRTQQIPTREIPEESYDTGDGFYNPRTKCVTDPKTTKVLRIPTDAEDEWIKEHCRRAWDENCGFRPALYENWFDPEFDPSPPSTNGDDDAALKSVNSSEEFNAQTGNNLGTTFRDRSSSVGFAPNPAKRGDTAGAGT